MKSVIAILTLFISSALLYGHTPETPHYSPENELEYFSPDPIVGGPIVVCQNQTGVVYELTNNLDPGITYAWSVEFGTIIGPTNGSSIVVDWGTDNPAKVNVVVTSADGSCSTPGGVQVAVVEPVLFSVVIDANPSSIICDGDSLTFFSKLINADSLLTTYEWFINGQSVGTDPEYAYTTANDGDVVYCEATTTTSCLLNTVATSEVIVVSVTPRPEVSIFVVADQNPICVGDDVEFTTIISGVSQPTYQWQVNGVDVGFGFPTYNASGLVNDDQVSCTVTSVNDCALNNPASDTVTIQTLDAFPSTIEITADLNPACEGDLISFTSTVTNEGDDPTYQWQANGVDITGSTDAFYSSNNLSDGDVITCIMMSSSNCSNTPTVVSDEIVVSLMSSLLSSVILEANPNPFCAGDDVEFTANVNNPAPNPNFTWYINGVQHTTTLGEFINLSNLNNGDVVSVTYDAEFNDCIQQGSLSDTITLSADDAIDVSVTLTADQSEICAGETVTFTPIPVNGGTDPSYQWILNGIPLGDSSDIYVTNNLNNNDIISVQLTTSLTCAENYEANSNALLMTVSDLNLDVVSLVPGCNEQGSIEVAANGGANGNYNYEWSNGQVGPIASGLSGGTYTVTVTDDVGCVDTLSFDLDDVDAPEILDATTTIASCGFADGSISVDLAGGLLPYDIEWTDESGNLISTDLQQPNIYGGTYTLIVTDSNGCYVTDTFTVPVEDPAAVVAPEDVTIDLGDSIRIVSYAETLDPVDFLWSPATSVSCDTCAITYLMPLQTTTYTVTITQDGGCTSSDSITVTVLDNRRVFIPNIFSPNFDGTNDVFTVIGGAGIAQIKAFRVYDRWGALLHSVENVAPNDNDYGWDGSFKGSAMPTGVYVYYAELEFLNGNTEIFRGDVTLVR